DDRLRTGVELDLVRRGRGTPAVGNDKPQRRGLASLEGVADGDVQRHRSSGRNRRAVRLDPRAEAALAEALRRQQLVVQFRETVSVRNEGVDVAVTHLVREEVPADQNVRLQAAQQLA